MTREAEAAQSACRCNGPYSFGAHDPDCPASDESKRRRAPSSQSASQLEAPDGYRVVKTFMNLQGRHTAHVESDDGAVGALGYSWSTYEAAVTDAVAYLEGLGRP